MRTTLNFAPHLVSLLVLVGCATAPAGNWAPNEWKPADAPVAKASEPAPPTKTVEAPPLNEPSRTVPVVSPTEPPPSPVATLPASPTAEDKPAPEAKPVVDEGQLSRERAQAAITLLDNMSGGVRAAVCSARSLLAQVPTAYRQEPRVVEAQKKLKSKEPAALREEVAAFEENRMYLCRDGEPSPSCHCNGPKRGCCSHHGGVAGCEPLPTEITCP
ncbi:MAG TPA: hypothetical protein PK156_39530 [Polyangium sp.]|nr:hypothetical protein [Polyangium sp.]